MPVINLLLVFNFQALLFAIALTFVCYDILISSRKANAEAKKKLVKFVIFSPFSKY